MCSFLLLSGRVPAEGAMARAQPCPQALTQSQARAALPSLMASAASGQPWAPAPGALHLQGSPSVLLPLGLCSPAALTGTAQTCRTGSPGWEGNKEDTAEFWPLRSCTLGDQTLKLLLADPILTGEAELSSVKMGEHQDRSTALFFPL